MTTLPTTTTSHPASRDGSRVGRPVETEWGPGVILAVTGRSVTVLLDAKEWGRAQTINLARNTPGWDRLARVNEEALP